MTALFDVAVAAILISEGVFSDDKHDPGGKTKYGIAEATGTLDEAKRRGIVPESRRIEDVTRDEAIAIYQQVYWNGIRGDSLPAPLALVTFDAAVNHGVEKATRMLQAALGVNVDGVIGWKTLDAARRQGLDAQDRMLSLRAQRYFKRTIDKPSQKRFLDGWLIRTYRVAREAAKLA